MLPTGSVRLDTHRPIGELEGYAEGEWWVQDAAAALACARLSAARPGMRVVDLCAAPGGKSAELAASGAAVTTVDRSAERLKVLAANFERLKLHADIVVADALAFEAAPFDAASASTRPARRPVPSAATPTSPGPSARAISPRLVKLQAQLLDKTIALTRPGGLIVYCTCSLEPEEGEGADRRGPAAKPGRPSLAGSKPNEIGGLAECVTAAGELRTLPCHLWGDDPRRSGLDGFFAARLVKAG